MRTLQLLGLIICSIAGVSLAATDPPRTATVICTDESGKPIAGAEVYLLGTFWDGISSDRIPQGPQTSAADGSTRFTIPPASLEGGGNLCVYARVSGKLAGVAYRDPNVVNGGPLEVPFKVVLRPSQVLSGKVTAPAGVDPARLRVHLMSLSIRAADEVGRAEFFQRSRVLPDAGPWPEVFEYPVKLDGSVSIRDIPEGANMSLVVAGPGVAYAALRQPRQGGEDARWEAQLFEESVIEGALGSEDGKGAVAGIEISAVQDLGAGGDFSLQFPYRATTDAQGHFRFAGLRQGIYEVAVQPLPDGWTTLPARIRLERGQPVRDADLRLQRGLIVQGTVVDAATKQPLAGAIVAASSMHEWGTHMLGRSAPTDAEGRFSVRAPIGPVSLHVFRVPKEFGHAEPVELVLTPDMDQIEEIRFELGPPKPKPDLARSMAPKGKIRGRVVDPHGQPLAGVRVQLKQPHPADGEQFWMSRAGPTNEQGTYEFGFLDADVEHRVEVPLWSTTDAQAAPVTTKGNQTMEVPDLVVTARTAVSQIAGVVMTRDDRPISGAWVNLGDVASVQTGADGRFRFDLYDEDVPTLRVFADPFEDAVREDISAGSNDLRIVLQPRDPLKPR